jgi:hypothetical protein
MYCAVLSGVEGLDVFLPCVGGFPLAEVSVFTKNLLVSEKYFIFVHGIASGCSCS